MLRLRSQSLAQRRNAVAALLEQAKGGQLLSPQAVDQCGRLALSLSEPEDIREQCLAILVACGSVVPIREELVAQWILGSPFPTRLSARISNILADDPSSLSEICEAAESLSASEWDQEGRQRVLQDVFVCVRALLTQFQGRLTTEQVAPATKLARAVSSNAALANLANDIIALIESSGWT